MVHQKKKKHGKQFPCNKRPDVYQQKSGGWVVKPLGAKRRYHSKAKAEEALRGYHCEMTAKACLSAELGGSVEPRYTSTPETRNSTRYQGPSYKTHKQAPLNQNSHKHNKSPKSATWQSGTKNTQTWWGQTPTTRV